MQVQNKTTNFQGMKINAKHLKQVPQLKDYKARYIPKKQLKGLMRANDTKRASAVQVLNKKLDKAGVFNEPKSFAGKLIKKIFGGVIENVKVDMALGNTSTHKSMY